MKDVVCIHRVAQSWNPKAKGLTAREVTNVKRKTLGYYKLQMKEKLLKIIQNIL